MMVFAGYIAIYFILWWITLFLVLPFSGKTQIEAGHVISGTEKSAPSDLKIWKIVMINTIVSSVIFAGFYLIKAIFGFNFNDILMLFPQL